MERFEFKNLLKCEYCNKTYELPVILPCGETICRRDLKDLFKEDSAKGIIQCFYCGDEHHVIRDHKFPPNKLVERFLQRNLDKFDLGEKFLSAKSSLDLLQKHVDELENIAMDPSKFLENFFHKLSDTIELKKENVKTLIDLSYEQMIKDLILFKYECESSLELTNIKYNLSNELDFIKDKLSIWFTQMNEPCVNEEKWNLIHLDAQLLDNDICDKIKRLKDLLFLNINCKFDEKYVDLGSNIFGQLKLEYPEVECAKNQLKIKTSKRLKKESDNNEIYKENEILLKSKLN